MSMKTIVAIVCLGAAFPVAAQDSRGTITGRVADSSGAPVVNAEVHVTHSETGTRSTGRSNDAGNYAIPFLLPGGYDITVDYPGFKRMERSRVIVRVSDVLAIDFKLEVGNVNETVDVKGGSQLLETANVSLAKWSESARFRICRCKPEMRTSWCCSLLA